MTVTLDKNDYKSEAYMFAKVCLFEIFTFNSPSGICFFAYRKNCLVVHENIIILGFKLYKNVKLPCLKIFSTNFTKKKRYYILYVQK